MGQPGKRPTGVTVTAWLWIVSGALMAVSGLMGAFAYSALQRVETYPGFPANASSGLGVATTMLEYFDLLLVAQTMVAILALWAGIALLQLKAWARTTIEALSWLGLLYCLGFGVAWIYLWVSMTSRMPRGQIPVDPATLEMIGAVAGVVITALFAIPLYLMIRYLRGTEVRAAVAKAPGSNA